VKKLAVALAALAGACAPWGGVSSGANLCTLAAEETLTLALGSAPVEIAPQGSDHPACRWTGALGPDGLPRVLTAEVWTARDLRRVNPPVSAPLFFESQLFLLEKDYGRTRVLGGMGEAAVIGFGEIGEERFTGAILVRKQGAVLSLSIEGADPAAFEQAAREIAEAL
jgi:hypothetical protein